MPDRDSQSWIFVWCSLDCEDATIDGVSINNAEWTRSGQTAAVVDPIHGTLHDYPIFHHAKEDGKMIRMAHREHTNGVYLAFVASESDATSVEPQTTIESIKPTLQKRSQKTNSVGQTPASASLLFSPLFWISFTAGILTAIAIWISFK